VETLANVNITGFQLARRRQEEEEKRKEKELIQAEQENAAEAENGPLNVDQMTIEEVKEKLDELGVKYAPKTGDAKLREKLKSAL
jgi:aspartate/methionine/tyrosine aminotransferase